MIELVIEESQGFILPSKLYENDPALKIESLNNIQRAGEPLEILESMMVGDGPDENQRLCMYQYEYGTRTVNPFCSNPSCLTRVIDACSEDEQLRCGCEGKLALYPSPLTIFGFQFKINDTISFIHTEDSCQDPVRYLVDVFDTSTMFKSINSEQNRFLFNQVRATQTGHFKMCFEHMGVTKDIGTITVRPACKIPFVLVEGACVTYCPKTKIPMAGECKWDSGYQSPDPTQALMVSIIMENPDAVGYRVWDQYIARRRLQLSNDDPTMEERPERTYFVYRFRYDMARTLNAAPSRFHVASISKGPSNSSFYVNAVFKAGEGENDGRHPFGLYSLFKSLVEDENSILWQGDFLRYIDRSAVSEAKKVSLCDDDIYRAVCPYAEIGRNSSAISRVFFLVVFGAVLIMLLVGCLLWRIDHEQGQSRKEIEDEEKATNRPLFEMDPNTRSEFAKSWVESRFYGETKEGFSLAKEKLGGVKPKDRRSSFSYFVGGNNT